ncbi:peptidase [Streptomyces viridiviolaceus]|uniref:S8 family serine peptidase n=1 Tax=Streptomyces viridiviolaceus TaxID=68282 RepID=A0ABW2EEV8_9ACTN|nr:S8 family serine peptidase [Streptomyces viridiviolaceus]GHB39065.1 peptidase [Streptomyces viridiviolaceus]
MGLRRRIRLAAATSVGLALVAGAVSPVIADATEPKGGAVTAVTSDETATVRLITGDKVTVRKVPGIGRQTAGVEPGPGRQGIVFRTVEEDGRLTVLPSDAAGLVSAGRLDGALFDVTALIAQRYDEAHTDALPLILGDSPAGKAPAARELTAFSDDGSPVRELTSIKARSVRVDQQQLGRFWESLVPDGTEVAADRVSTMPRIWLDGRVAPVLDRSTRQIGAPAAWDGGFRGDGVKVAVLDTGADASHPDLAGRITEAKDFSGSSGTGDVFGHGTHVASIVGGSGAASDGSRKGVAPDADLLIGKVLGDDGYGSESQVIAGMEWAASEGAQVVNMSLGSEQATDGRDPMSLALNELGRRTGTLFVVAAGNSGEQGARTVGSPGAADAALTVGAVDRDDSLAAFSSRGPRLGDDSVKPDVTAPGVGIVAARAAGTTMGDPVDEHHVAASGTSMATPHVAGAAALLAQRHPDWDGTALKDALISSADTMTGQKVTEQGGGRIDVAAALGPVSATGTVTLGSFEAGTTAPRTVPLTYTNSSAEDVTLTLTPRWSEADGRAVPAEALRLGSGTVRVPAGGTAEVPLTLDPAHVPQGKYYGYVSGTASDDAVTVHTTLSLVVHGPVHRLTVRTLDKDGDRVQALPTIWGAEGFVDYTDPDTAVAEVEEGVYSVSHASIDTASDGQELREVIQPEVNVTKDTVVTLDARATRAVDIRTPQPAEQRGTLSYQTYRELDGHSALQGTMYFDNAKRLYVSPTATVTHGTFEFSSRWQLVAPLLEATVAGTGNRLNAYYMPNSPLLDEGGSTLTAMAAGDATEPSLAHARGKVAVLTNRDGIDERPAIERAAAAGARAVVLVHWEDNAWTRWTPDGERMALPTIRVGARSGDDLLDRIARRTTKLRFGGTARSPYLYDVMQVAKQRIPRHVRHDVTASNSAVVRTTYADNGGTGWAAEQRFGWRPFQTSAWLQYTRYVPTGFERTEYVSAGDTTWQHLVHHRTTYDVDLPLALGMRDTPRSYKAGTRADETWQGAVVRPSIPAGTTTPTVRSGDVLRLRVPEFTDSQAGHWSRLLPPDGGGIGTSAESGDSAGATLYRDGARVAELADAWQDVEVPTGPADYRLDLKTRRVADDWRYGTATDTSWSFRSGGTTDAPVTLNLLQLDYEVQVAADNSLAASGKYGFLVTVRAQEGLPAPRGVRTRVETSYDDGRTWQRAQVRDRGHNAFQATAPRPSAVHGSTPVSVRVTATDAAGASVRQTVTRAFLLTR